MEETVLKLVKKYHNIGMELRDRKKLVSDYRDNIVIDLQISTNEKFITDLIKLILEICEIKTKQ